METLKLAEKISKRLEIPFYVARYQVGNQFLGYGHEWFLFFKEQELPEKAFRFWRRFSLGFKKNESFGILEKNIKSFKNVENKFNICYKDENGLVYKRDLTIK